MDTVMLSLIGYGVAINLVALLLMAQDKTLSRKKSISSRTSEGLLFLIGLLGGTIGIYAGMFLCRHKTKKLTFVVGFPLLLIQQLLLLNAYVVTFLPL